MKIKSVPRDALAVRAETDLQGLRANAAAALPFCDCYAGDGVTALLHGGEMILSAAPDTGPDALADFLRFSGAVTVSCDRPLPLTDWIQTKGSIFRGRPLPCDPAGLSEITLRQAEPIFTLSFPALTGTAWYADLSHRVRHGVSRIFGYKNCGAAVLLCENSKTAFLGMIAVRPDKRRRRYGQSMVGAIASVLPDRELAVYSKNKDADRFYAACGLSPAGLWYEYRRQEDI